MGSDCPARASEPQDSSHHPFPTHSAASPPSLLSSPQAGAFNYSCPPLQPVHAGLLPSAFSCAGWEAPAAVPACWLWSGAGEPCREEELPGFFPAPCTGDTASPQRSRGWRLEGAVPRLPRALPCSVPSHPSDYSINYFHKHFAFRRIFSHFLVGILHAMCFSCCCSCSHSTQLHLTPLLIKRLGFLFP